MRQLDERLLLFEEVRCERHGDRLLRRKRVAEYRRATLAGSRAFVPRAFMKGEHLLDGARHVAQLDAVDHDLVRRVGCQHQLLHGDVGERQRMHAKEATPEALLDGLEGPLEVVAVIESLRERVADAFPAASALEAEELPAAAFQAAALHLKADHRSPRMAEHEVDLAVGGAGGVIAEDPPTEWYTSQSSSSPSRRSSNTRPSPRLLRL